jgi:hypothetical protein
MTTIYDKKPEAPRLHRPVERPKLDEIPTAVQAPDEPLASERSEPTATRTIRDGEIQGHPREMPGDRDSQ